MKQLYLNYDDVALVPKMFHGTSRSLLSTKRKLGNHEFELPVMPANMKCVIDAQVAFLLSQNNYFYVMHRFGKDIISNFAMLAQTIPLKFLSISMGVNADDFKAIQELGSMRVKVDYVTIDIAHGHCTMMQQAIKHVRKHLPDAFIIAGNVATTDAFNDLVNWGADAVKVGIGPGAACTTKLKTGFTSPMFSTLLDISHYRDIYNDDIIIIADGGIRHNGDIAKALVAGADWVMIGSLFSQCTDSPALLVDGHKEYFGSASAFNKENPKNIEGTRLHLPACNLTIVEKMQEMKQDLQSAISYAGGTDLKAFDYVEWNVIK